MSKQRRGTATHAAQPLRSIPHVTRQLSEFGIEERTQVDLNVSTRVQRDEGLIPSITGKSRLAKGSTPPPNVIPFTKPRAIAAVAAANPKSLVIEASAQNALKNFDNTVLPPTPKPSRDEPTTPFTAPPSPQGSSERAPARVINAASPTNRRSATGWTPPGAVPTVPVSQAPAAKVAQAPAARTIVPVPALHTGQSSAPVLSLPPIEAPPGTPIRPIANATVAAFPPVAPVAAYPVAKPAPAQRGPAPKMFSITPSAQVASVSAPVAWPMPAQQMPVHQIVQQMPAQQMPAQQMPAQQMPAQQMPVQQMPVQAPAAPPPRGAEAPIGDFTIMPEHASAKPATGNKWAVFEKLGLGAPKINAQKVLVNAYRLLGFAILTIIVVVLIGYIANTAFFYMSSSWVVPAQVSPTDERVVALQAQLAEQQNTRDRLSDEFNQAERSIAAQQSFQLEFAKAIKMDLDGRKAALGRVRELANNAASTRRAIKSQNAAYAGNARNRMALEYQAGLIDRNAMLSGGVQLAQLTSSNLTLQERQAEFETRAAELEATTKSLDAILSNIDGDSALSYEVLRIKQEYAASRLDLAKAVEARNTIKASLMRQDKIVGSLKKSSYLRAVEDGAAVAFVPYGNLSNVSKGTDVYACKVGMVFCYHVGEVIEVLPGEVQFKHPQRDKQLRGQMVEMKLDDDDDDAAAGDVLYVGGKPLFI